MVRPVVRNLLDRQESTRPRIWIPELIKYQELFRDYKITFNQGLACEDNVRRAGRLHQDN